jgi:tellurite resistance protein TerC
LSERDNEAEGKILMASTTNPLFWAAFLLVVLCLILLDLGLFHRKSHSVRIREAAIWSAVWVALSLSFGVGVYLYFGAQKGLEFFAGYVVEYALSVDNLFVFILIFSYFKVPNHLHHKVLFWGILGALVMRLVFIFVGTALIYRFHWILYIFGAFLLYTGIKMLRQGETEVDPGKNFLVKSFRRLLPMTQDYVAGHFWLKNQGKLLFTPLALVLITVESTDLLFAVDSIPAVFGVTTDRFIVYTSNICAILGLRSMYFLLAAALDKYTYLGTGVALVLIFIGLKMIAGFYYELSTGISLAVIAVVLGTSVLISLWRKPKPASQE